MVICKRKKAATCGNQVEQVLMGRELLKVKVSIADIQKATQGRSSENMAMWLALTGPARMA
jgi:hypothetical protein